MESHNVDELEIVHSEYESPDCKHGLYLPIADLRLLVVILNDARIQIDYYSKDEIANIERLCSEIVNFIEVIE
jgi:hypothetical protein